MLSHVRLAFIGQRESATAAVFVGTDQALILQLLKRRVDRAWAGLPGPATAFGNLLDDLVPVHRALSQHGQDRRRHVIIANQSSLVLARSSAHRLANLNQGATQGAPIAYAPPTAITSHEIRN